MQANILLSRCLNFTLTMLRKQNYTLLLLLLFYACANNSSDKPGLQSDSSSIQADSAAAKINRSLKDGEILSFATG